MSESDRLKKVYEARDAELYARGWKHDIYHPRHPMGRLFHEHRQDVVTDALNAIDFDLEPAKILDVGCGAGGWLRMLVELGATPAQLIGMDLSRTRIEDARKANPGIQWQAIDGDALPAADAQFDMILQSTVFSSILDPHLAHTLAAEMWRVAKPGAIIFWVDLLVADPSRLRVYPLDGVRDLFPAARVIYQRNAYPGYFRTLFRYPALCRAMARLSDAKAEYLIAILKKP